jgi:uncharacterized protein YjbI with pentapeptide repeats
MSQTPDTPDPKVARADALRQAADESARLVRTLVVTFLLVGVYVAIIVFGTTDVQLLKETPVRLPFFEVGVPLVGFYAVVPWVVVLLHLNLLLQLTLLSRKLHAFDAAVVEIDDPRIARDQRDRLYAFPFSDMLAGRHDSPLLRTLLAAIVWATVLILPLALLIAAQVRFLPYRSDAVTASQALAVLATLAAIWAFWPVAVTGRSWRDWGTWAVGCLTVGEVAAVRRSLPVALRSRRNAARRWRRRFGDGPMRHGLRSLVLATLIVAGPATLWATGLARDRLFRTHLVLPEAVLVRGDPPTEVVTALRSDDAKARAAALDRVLGLDLRGRDLSEAVLARSVLPKADLREATLTETDLELATLTEADLRWATLTEADLSLAKLIEADLVQATLTEAYFVEATLTEADLYGATLTEAALSGATLTEVNLIAATLTEAALSGATLTDADLRAVTLAYARLSAANLSRVRTGCAIALSESGSTEICTDFRGASMRRTALDGADLRQAWFDPDTLNGACGTDVRLPDAFKRDLPACEDVNVLPDFGDPKPPEMRDDAGPRITIHQD